MKQYTLAVSLTRHTNKHAHTLSAQVSTTDYPGATHDPGHGYALATHVSTTDYPTDTQVASHE